jgi:hypothetical protein
MKTKQQIEHFLRKRKYRSQIDYDGISLYCRNKFNIRLHVPSSYSDEPEALDYSSFADWLEHGYGAGEAVEWDGNIGLVQDSDLTSVKICLRIDGNGPNFDSTLVPVQVITPAPESALKRLYEVLRENQLEFGNPFFAISEKFVPASCNLVTFKCHKTNKEGFGVVRNVNADGDIVMYCYCVKGEPIRYGMNEYLGSIEDYTFKTFSPADYSRKVLENELNKVGKTWNHYTKRIEPVNMRVKEGEKYWYITDKMQVTSDHEKNNATSNKRYLCANYFRTPEEANEIQKKEMELRRELLARPETGFVDVNLKENQEGGQEGFQGE